MTGKDGEFHHSKAYHRFFAGYTEEKSVNNKGRQKIKRVYTQDYYVSGLSRRKEIGCRVLYALLTAASVFLFVKGAGTRNSLNNLMFFQLTAAAGTICYFFFAAVMIFYLIKPFHLTIYEYESTSRRIFYLGIISAVLSIAESPVNPLFCLCSAAMLALVVFIEKRVPYRVQKNDVKPPEDGCEIW